MMGLKFIGKRCIVMDLEVIAVLLLVLCLWCNGDQVLKMMHSFDMSILNLGEVKD